jgi:hypothetical protein
MVGQSACAGKPHQAAARRRSLIQCVTESMHPLAVETYAQKTSQFKRGRSFSDACLFVIEPQFKVPALEGGGHGVCE